MPMIRPAHDTDVVAIEALRQARNLLGLAGASRARAAAARALKSAEGVVPHVRHRLARSR